ncbi:MAG: helix-turn-helix transcriptional regulator [Solirubrobacterales bacterium]|nr:helix-turn-helix transcriptional regulator [Solirubrobacterales bacterium]MBV9716973.1 helix-turn-helix transcriptional regulator [Solirubrobacterales bacterium]
MPAPLTAARPDIGPLLRQWRARRRLSQLDLALEAGISARHLSFIETGRARPSADMVDRLSEALGVPLRERNSLLLAAGFAPAYPERDLDEDAMAPVREAIERLLAAHEPYPALVVDRQWELMAANRAVAVLTAAAAPALLEPPVNVLRLSLHPEGLAPRIINLAQWGEHILARLRRQAIATGDPALFALHDELSSYLPGGPSHADHDAGMIAVPLRIDTDIGQLSFLSTATHFGTATELTLAELAIEAFHPADTATAQYMAAAVPPAGG